VHGLQRDRLAETGTVDLLLKDGLLCVCRITRQEGAGTMTTVPSVPSIKGSEGFRLEDDQPRSEPLRFGD
jgi:hypothetical protein